MLPMDIGLFDVEGIITGAGPWALAVVCLIVFVETGLLGRFKRRHQRHNALFLTIFINEQYFVCPDIPVSARSTIPFGRRGRMRSACYGSSPC